MLPDNSAEAADESRSSIERRQHPRTSCHWPALVRLDDGTTSQAIVVDASKGGMRLVCDAPVVKGSLITVDLQKIGRYSCEVRWKTGCSFGVMFLSSPGELSENEVEVLAEYL